MIISIKNVHRLLHAQLLSRVYFTLMISVGASSAQAAPGILSDQPLSLVTSTKPNILLLLDDSGSMDFENVITTEAQIAHDDDLDGVNSKSRTAVQQDRELWRLCAGYNALAFNPSIEYEKWQDYIGHTFDDKQSDNIGGTVLDNPLDTAGTADLSDHIYIRWDDSSPDGQPDGLYQVGECGPGVGGYDSLAAGSQEFPSEGTITIPGPGGVKTGVFTDSNDVDGSKYNFGESGRLVIDVPGGDSSDTITFSVGAFNVDRSSGDTDSLTVYGGLDISNPIVDAITVTERYSSSPPSLESVNEVSSTLVLDDSFSGNRAHEIKTFMVKGSQVTLVFDGGSNQFTRSGFSISWVHSDYSGDPGDGLVTKSDCSGSQVIDGALQIGVSNCVNVDELPLTEADALANPLTVNQPYNTQENYANWYTYYRNRDYVAKKALGDLVRGIEYRVGFTTINDNGDGGVIIKDMTNNSGGTITQEKSDLLQKIYKARTAKAKPEGNDGTPLVKGLSNAGRYFKEGVSPDADFFGTTAESGAIETAHDEGNTVDTASPILNNANGGQCQQNFTLVFSDGAWGDDVGDYADTGHDVNGASSGFIGNFDKFGVAYDPNNPTIYEDNASNTLADVSMYYFAKDLAPSATDSLSVQLHGESVAHQHMVTFTVGFGVDGTLDRNPTIGATPADTGLWPASVSSIEQKIDDLRHAGFNGRGDYLSATNVQSLQQSLDDIITEIGIRVDNTAAGASFSAFELAAGEFRYDTKYNNVIWWGELEAFAYDDTLGLFKNDSTWSADKKMADRGDNRYLASDPDGRKIITYNGAKGIPFEFSFTTDYRDAGEANALSANQVSDLLASAPHVLENGNPDNGDAAKVSRNHAYGRALVDYIRGLGTYDNTSLDGKTAYGVDFDSSTDGSQLHLFRDRKNHYLGAFIHSQPEFVGVPNNGYPDEIEPTSHYSEFVDHEVHKNRRSMIYVGGNDGMLHGFYAEDKDDVVKDGGKEVFAYIPHIVSDSSQGGRGLHKQALESFDGLPYVDGSPVVSDVYVNRADVGDSSADNAYESVQWRSYLVGGLRAGGRGIYVLDVTNPDNNSSAITHPVLSDAQNVANKIVVNEFTNSDLGYVFGRPQIGKMNNGRWAAIVGNGYNSSSTGEGKAALFIVYLDKPTEPVGDNDTDGDGIRNDGQGDYSVLVASAASWIHCANDGEECTLPEAAQIRYGANGNYVTQNNLDGAFICEEAVLGNPGDGVSNRTCEYSDNNGLSQPAIADLDGNGTIDRIYAGDLHGNMWVFNVSAKGTTAGVDAHTKGAVDWGLHDTVDGKPLFTACGSTLDDENITADNLLNAYGVCPVAHRQPITTAPLIRNHPRKNNETTEPNQLVFFGTGQYLVDADKDSHSIQSFYTVWDAGTSSKGLDKSNLTARTIINLDNDTRSIEEGTVNYSLADGQYGWYYSVLPDVRGTALSASKERIALEPLLFGNTLLFQTLIPKAGSCNANAGSGFIMAIDPLTGGNPDVNLFGETDSGNVAGIKVSSVIVGASITKNKDGTKLNIKTADGVVQSIDISGGLTESITSGKLYNNKGRKSWSILR